MDDGELMDEFPRGVAQLRSGVDGNDGGRSLLFYIYTL